MKRKPKKSADVFDAKASRAARDRGIEAITTSANPEWQAYMYEMTVLAARLYREFTADDVFKLAIDRGDMPVIHDRRAFGSVMRRAQSECIATLTDRVRRSVRKSLHCSPLSIWESRIYRPSALRLYAASRGPDFLGAAHAEAG